MAWGRVQTNMVLFDVDGLGATDERFVYALKEKGILAAAIAKSRIRLVTHRGIERRHVEKALSAIENVVANIRRD